MSVLDAQLGDAPDLRPEGVPDHGSSPRVKSPGRSLAELALVLVGIVALSMVNGQVDLLIVIACLVVVPLLTMPLILAITWRKYAHSTRK